MEGRERKTSGEAGFGMDLSNIQVSYTQCINESHSLRIL